MAHYDCSRCGGSTLHGGPNSCDCTEGELREWRNQRMSEQDKVEKPLPEEAVERAHDRAASAEHRVAEPRASFDRSGVVEAQLRGEPLPPPSPELTATVGALAASDKLPEERAAEAMDFNYHNHDVEEEEEDGYVTRVGADGPERVELAISPADQSRAQLGMGANARQPGGEHYKAEYQHWDFVVDTEMHYLLGCATKYVSRWRKKGGRMDLEKAEHYLQKATECDIFPPRGPEVNAVLNRFVEQLEANDRAIVVAVVQGNYEAAVMSIRWLLADDTA